MPVLYQYSEVILAKGFIFVFLYLCFLAIKKNSWLDLWLMSFQQKVCFISLHKWYLYLFRVHNKFQTRFLFLWIFCLLPLFYFFNYFIDCFYFIFVAFFQKVWAIPDFTFRSWHTCMEYFSFMKFTDLYMNFILLLNTEIVGFFNTFPLFCGFKNLNYLDALYFNLFFFFLIILGWKVFKIQQLIFYTYFQFNFLKIIYYFFIFKISLVLLFSSYTAIWPKDSAISFFDIYESCYLFFFVYILEYIFISITEIVSFFDDFIFLLQQYNWSLSFWTFCLLIEHLFLIVITFFNNCYLYFCYLVFHFWEIQYFMPFFWFFSCICFIYIYCFAVFLNPQSFFKYYEYNFIKYYNRAYDRMGEAVAENRAYKYEETYHFDIGLDCPPMMRPFSFEHKRLYFLEQNLKQIYHLPFAYPDYEDIFYRFDLHFARKTLRYRDLLLAYPKLFNPLKVFYVLYIPLSYIRLKMSRRFLNRIKIFEQNQGINKLKHLHLLESEFCTRWIDLLHKCSRKISPLEYSDWVKYYEVEELNDRHPGLLDIFSLYR
jgi:hypothetical protein